MHPSPKTILLLLLCGLGVCVKAQTVWNKTYIDNRPAMLFGSVLFIDTSYIFTGSAYGSNLVVKSIVGNINLYGELTQYKLQVDSQTTSYTSYSNALIKTKDGRIAFTGGADDSLAYLLFCIAKLNLDSAVVFKYYTPNTHTYYGCSLLQDGSDYFITGVRLDGLGYNGDVFLMKIDSAGNRLWEKYYHQTVRDEAHSIIKLSNGNLMLGAAADDLNQTHARAHTWLLEVDTAGTLVRQWFDPNDSTYVAEGLTQTSDGGFIYGAQKKCEQSVNQVFFTATIVKMDSAFNKQWTFSGGYKGDVTGFTDIHILYDGNYIACGNYNNAQGWIVKLDTAGHIIWERKYVGITTAGSKNYLTDIDELPDMSLIAVGQCQQSGAPPQVGWFLKLDSNGCEIENCLTGISQSAIENPQFAIFPNPATSSFSLDIENPLLQGGSLDLYNIDGKKLSSTANNFNRQTKVDISQFPNGIYLWRYTAPNQVVQSGKVIKE